MLQSRRGLLVGAGSLLTTAFVAKAETFVRDTCTPLLVQPSEVRQILYWYPQEGTGTLLLCLNGSPHIMPLPPTWREFINTHYFFPGRPIRSDQFDMWRRYLDVEIDQLDQAMDAIRWRYAFDFRSSPSARASSLLAGIHFGDGLDRFPRDGRPHVNFVAEAVTGAESLGKYHFISWVTASDMLALSLLQARLIDLNLPIKLERGKREF